jgi:hypothetical protein
MQNKPLNLHIETPCHENWDAMQPNENGRFCGSCKKMVIDFSKKTDDEVLHFFENYKNKNNQCCIRIETARLNKPILPQKTPLFRQYYRPILTAAVIASLSILRVEAQTGKGAKTVGVPAVCRIIPKGNPPKKDSLPKNTAKVSNDFDNDVEMGTSSGYPVKPLPPHTTGGIKPNHRPRVLKEKETPKAKFIPKSGPKLPRVKTVDAGGTVEKNEKATPKAAPKVKKVKTVKRK